MGERDGVGENISRSVVRCDEAFASLVGRNSSEVSITCIDTLPDDMIFTFPSLSMMLVFASLPSA